MFGMKQFWPNLKYYPSIFPGGTEENHEIIIRITGAEIRNSGTTARGQTGAQFLGFLISGA
jgi:hypothetical protein